MRQFEASQTKFDRDTSLFSQQADEQSKGLVARAIEVQSVQLAAVEQVTVETAYPAELTTQVAAKHDQAERIEDRLENLVENQGAEIEQLNARQPGVFSLPGAKARWQQQMEKCQATMRRLQGRLETVREIKDGMGLHSPKLEELAARKLRHQQPELVEGWDELQEANRRHQEMLRRQRGRGKNSQHERDDDEEPVVKKVGRSLGRSLSIKAPQ